MAFWVVLGCLCGLLVCVACLVALYGLFVRLIVVFYVVYYIFQVLLVCVILDCSVFDLLFVWLVLYLNCGFVWVWLLILILFWLLLWVCGLCVWLTGVLGLLVIDWFVYMTCLWFSGFSFAIVDFEFCLLTFALFWIDLIVVFVLGVCVLAYD